MKSVRLSTMQLHNTTQQQIQYRFPQTHSHTHGSNLLYAYYLCFWWCWKRQQLASVRNACFCVRACSICMLDNEPHECFQYMQCINTGRRKHRQAVGQVTGCVRKICSRRHTRSAQSPGRHSYKISTHSVPTEQKACVIFIPFRKLNVDFIRWTRTQAKNHYHRSMRGMQRDWDWRTFRLLFGHPQIEIWFVLHKLNITCL